jgi:hypothetical protein
LDIGQKPVLATLAVASTGVSTGIATSPGAVFLKKGVRKRRGQAVDR